MYFSVDVMAISLRPAEDSRCGMSESCTSVMDSLIPVIEFDWRSSQVRLPKLANSEGTLPTPVESDITIGLSSSIGPCKVLDWNLIVVVDCKYPISVGRVP